MAKQKRNWLIDAVLFTGLLLAFFLDWTGLAWHQWLSVGVGVLALYHLVLHWSWVITVGKRFRDSSKQCRLNYLVDGILLINLSTIGISGLVISTWLDLPLEHYLLWRDIHIYSSIASLVLILIKIGLHWRWIIKTASRYFGFWNQSDRAPAVVTTSSGSHRGSLARREFLQLMGVAGIASLISAFNLLDLGEETSQSIIKSRFYGSNDTQSDIAHQAVIECNPICDQGCSFPGKCRRYIDQNNNGMCDLSECPDSPTTAIPETDNPGSNSFSPADNLNEGTSSGNEECSVLCPSACSYPGRCPDYRDTNGNNLCDLGECLVSNTDLPTPTSSNGGWGGRHHHGNK